MGGQAVLSITSGTNWTYYTYFLNILLNTSNILEYAHIYSNVSLSGRREGLSGVTGTQAGGQAGVQTTLYDSFHHVTFFGGR